MSESYRLGDYLLGMEGLAILRGWGMEPAAVRARADEIGKISAGLDGDLYGASTVIPNHDIDEGYRLWAPTYDSMRNILIEVEERVVHPLLDSMPAKRALDAACGTGRHAAHLAERGHEVEGIDASEEMLAVARLKTPAVRFRAGQLEALPLPDSSCDLVVCALALTHLPDIGHAIVELARVLVPGGRLIIADVHPMCAALGLHAFFRAADGTRGCIRNHYHALSHYLAAFRAANLQVRECIETPWDEETIGAQPTYPLIAEALQSALTGLPLLLVWELELPSGQE